MEAIKLYNRLEKDFILPGLSDDWAQHMGHIDAFVCDNFKKRSMGLVCDFTKEIGRVYTAVFPSKEVLRKILSDKAQGALLFVHHPSVWDIRKSPDIFSPMDGGLLEKFQKNELSIYNLHVPLDNNGKHSTSVCLAKALGITPTKPFAPYFGAMAGTFGKASCKTVQELCTKFQEAVGHEVSLYQYGDEKIRDGKVAVVAGGGLGEDSEEIVRNNVNVLVTGITAKNDYSKEAHELAEQNGISILGGTHYSTEKFACESMVEYFEKLGLPAKFLEDQPLMEDL